MFLPFTSRKNSWTCNVSGNENAPWMNSTGH
jgi:hypothetical protein